MLEAPEAPPPRPVDVLLDEALPRTFGSAMRVTIIVSDATRDEPRQAFVDAVLARLPPAVRVTLAIATGTHGPTELAALGLELRRFVAIVNHDGHRDDDLVDLGTTPRGTPVLVHRCVLDTDLVIATGCILPHYFAGFGAGAKAIFPGLGQARAIRTNHRWKTEPRARAGIVDGNPVREDLEAAVALVPTPIVIVNGVAGIDHQVRAVVCGELVEAHRRGCALARPWFTVHAPRARCVVASDTLPVTASLYQAAKIAAAVAPLVEPGGLLVVAAECADGIGPLETVNEAIIRIGVLPRLAPNVRLALASDLSDDTVATTLFAAVRLADLVPDLVIPRASQLLVESP